MYHSTLSCQWEVRHAAPHTHLRDKYGADLHRNCNQTVIGHMKCSSLLAEDNGVLGIGSAGEVTFGRRNFLELMSSFTTPLLVSVRHGNTELGEVAPTTLTSPGETAINILLGGRSWRVAKIEWDKRIAWVQPSDDEAGKATWPGSSRLMNYQLCRAIEAELVHRGAGVRFSKTAAAQYEQLCDEFSCCDGHFIPAVCDATRRARLWTFAGSAVNGPISQGLRKRGLDVYAFDNFSVTISRESVRLTSKVLRSLNSSDLYPAISPALEKALKFSTCLPPGLAAGILALRLRDEDGLRDTLVRPVREIIMVG
jgi:ATP-dependent Lhr-like helicase